MVRHRLAWCAVGGILALTAGCGSTPKPVVLKARLEAQQNVNPDARGRASPIVVRVYELKTAAAFEALDYFSLFDRDKETLGAELLGREELVLQPGAAKALDKQLQPGTRYLGVIAAFRNLERAQWRTVVAVPDKAKKMALLIRLDKTQITASPR